MKRVTKADFTAYERVRQSGLVNMWSPQVEDLAGISKEVHLAIIDQYDALNTKWPEIRKSSLWES